MPLTIIELPQFTEDVCEDIVKSLDEIPDTHFSERTDGNTLYRTIDRSPAKYRSIVNLDIPKSLREKLISLAPRCGSFLEEVIINRYHPGDYIPKHIDGHIYPRFCVVPLCESGDGFSAYYDGADGPETFYEDVIGTGLLVEGNKLVHAVNPVKNPRYVILYLYM